jgi:hypothetical protein
VAQGNHPVFYKRSIVQPGTLPKAGPGFGGVNENQMRLEYIADMLRKDIKNLGLDSAYSFSLAWKNNADYLNKISEIRNRIKRRYADMLAQLVDRSIITTDEAKSLDLNIAFNVADHRTNKRVRLAEIPQR